MDLQGSNEQADEGRSKGGIKRGEFGKEGRHGEGERERRMRCDAGAWNIYTRTDSGREATRRDTLGRFMRLRKQGSAIPAFPEAAKLFFWPLIPSHSFRVSGPGRDTRALVDLEIGTQSKVESRSDNHVTSRSVLDTAFLVIWMAPVASKTGTETE